MALQVYDKAVRTVPEDAKLAIYDRYLKRASTFFGIAKARSRGQTLLGKPCNTCNMPARIVPAAFEAYWAASVLSCVRCCARAAQVREIYEMAVEAEPPYSLSDADCKTMCLRYARVEKQVSVIKACRDMLRPRWLPGKRQLLLVSMQPDTTCCLMTVQGLHPVHALPSTLLPDPFRSLA